jgi:hypothetical protein
VITSQIVDRAHNDQPLAFNPGMRRERMKRTIVVPHPQPQMRDDTPPTQHGLGRDSSDETARNGRVVVCNSGNGPGKPFSRRQFSQKLVGVRLSLARSKPREDASKVLKFEDAQANAHNRQQYCSFEDQDAIR